MDDYSILDRCCSCHLGHAPCAYCTDTYECAKCHGRFIAEDEFEQAYEEELCSDCFEEREAEKESEPLSGDALMESIRKASGG